MYLSLWCWDSYVEGTVWLYVFFPFSACSSGGVMGRRSRKLATGKGRVISGNLFLAACLKDQRWKNEEKEVNRAICVLQTTPPVSGCVVVHAVET